MSSHFVVRESQHIDLWGDERFFFAGVIGWLYLLHEDEKHNLSLQDDGL